MATIHVTKPFTLTHDDGVKQSFAIGKHEVADHLAAHWYVKAHVEKPAVAPKPKADPEGAGKDAKNAEQPRAK